MYISRGSKKQKIEMDGGMLNIEYYGKPSQLKIMDKRHHTKWIDRIREDMELIFNDLYDVADEYNELSKEFDEFLQRLKEKKKKAKNSKKAKGEENE